MIISARMHRILTVVGIALTAAATIVSTLTTSGALAPTLAASIGSVLTALVTVVREMQSTSATPAVPPVPPAPPAP